MCGPFKILKNILRLLEAIFSALALITIMFRGGMVNPWGIWCEFVWVFCTIVPLVFIVIEALALNVLLETFITSWADLTCGLTMLCAVMITSASVIFAVIFVCSTCVTSIICLIFSLVATVIFLIDAVMQKMKCPSGYLSNLRGLLRMSEAFIACIIITAASSYFLGVEVYFRPAGMIWSVFVFAVCLLVTVVIIIFRLLKILQGLIPFGLGMIEFVFNIVAVLLYLSAIILWAVYGYSRHYEKSLYYCHYCVIRDLNTVTVGAIVNLILYIVDLALSFKDR
ncbi:myeloid-associated differentiation marker-like protein 2 [Myripristis murdjan]|uniref:myeloid-associated differentiation marker-like protein 2 n=1 Tax=Myripristis murdjan TaxID=586833 RepID=UPI001175C9A0|nr:myeloid-associated differentiation marker-like protein 2 [Myripristis murdjan]